MSIQITSESRTTIEQILAELPGVRLSETYRKFIVEAERAGLEVTAYEGRSFYRGPAVVCGDFADLVKAIRATTGTLQWDDLGHGYILYPR